MALAVNNDEGRVTIRDYLSALTMLSDWFFLVLVTFWQIIKFTAVQSADNQQEMRGVTARCRSKIRYIPGTYIHRGLHKSFIKKMIERINLTMKKWTKCNQNNTHWEKKIEMYSGIVRSSMW